MVFDLKASDDTKGTFLSKEDYNIINESHVVYADRIDEMLMAPTPKEFLSIEKSNAYRKLTPTQTKRLIKLLDEANNLDSKDDTLSKCEYKPGIKFYFECDEEDLRCNFQGGKRWLEVAVCFNCNIWAMNKTIGSKKTSALPKMSNEELNKMTFEEARKRALH